MFKAKANQFFNATQSMAVILPTVVVFEVLSANKIGNFLEDICPERQEKRKQIISTSKSASIENVKLSRKGKSKKRKYSLL